ncbi:MULTISPECIES: hypothetical protein [Ramlibacter]|uniref:Uncharacterized protein n=1 Tax=Ramlibacter pinisoli TaxID=2682844 RepID=A0A6N8IVS4_9BURK|nr:MULTISPECIES: hypothetical protein [Ramlibacter]MBA2965689.1 hypothetical protein [Ramlibacter sp. CGMCC 1.13660]MVQ30655.1 hypothetical protein [Ramlibacter pinisoli]
MRERKTSPPGSGVGAGADRPDARRNDTVTQQGEDRHGTPRLPHERDESADQQASTEPSGRRMARAGRADVERGVTDTSKGAELDATYDQLRKDLPDGEKQFRR